jgi:hypothetical protein
LALRSRTAWMSRIAASPRLTMAIRENIDEASLGSPPPPAGGDGL